MIDGRQAKLYFQHRRAPINGPDIAKILTLLRKTCASGMPKAITTARVELQANPPCNDEYPTVYEGIAICSATDNFTKETGRKIALRNALQMLSRDERKQVWRQYRHRPRHRISVPRVGVATS